ncbi:hypothetical protein POVCU1_060170 [Plasmodium ovale curtisi]|uniref:Uncharacterized protein n=1 Tax=Plasmodium ovale curtisi TaxID=864141 RepID=A0A1A8X5E1_PLAOA|nr:hypothetical protein POVCU1_060170 [Plasmodium ovale curtisi]
MHGEKKKRKGLEKNNLRVMKKEEIVAKNKIEKESIALFKKNLLKESYKWFKDTDYFVKIKNDNKYSNIENKTETKNVVTGLVSQGNYVKSCRMLSPYMGILSIFSLFGTITFCAKEICNFSIEFLQNVIRLSDRSEEKKYGMTKIFIDLTIRGKDCSSLPNTMYVESIDQCISFNNEVIKKIYEEIILIFREIGILRLTIFLYAHEYYLYNKNFGNKENYNFMKCNTYINMLHQLNEEETGSILPNTYGGPFNILSEEANYRFEQDDDKKVYTYKSLVKKYEKYDLRHNVSDNKSYTSSHYSKKKSVISASENWKKKKIDLNKSEKKKKLFFFNLYFFKKKIKKKSNYTQGGKCSHVDGKTSSLRKTISFKDINIKKKKRRDSSFYTSRKSSLFINEDSKNYSLSNFPKEGKKTSSYELYYGDRTNFNFEESFLENNVNMENETDNRQMKHGGGKNRAPIYAKGENSRNVIHTGHYSGSSGEGKSSFFDWTESDVSIGIMRGDKQSSGYWRVRHKVDAGEETCEEGGVQIGTYKVSALGNKKSDSEKRGGDGCNGEKRDGEKRDGEKRDGEKRDGEKRDGNQCEDEEKGKKCKVISKTISQMNKIILRKYGTFLLFFVIYSSWIFGMRLQMTQCGVISCLLHFITWIDHSFYLSITYAQVTLLKYKQEGDDACFVRMTETL